MRQYARFKERHPDCVLFFRMGDFYEMFDDDAQLAHRVLGITLTQRTEGVPMAGVPYHAVENYLRRMIEAGHRVAVCDQVQDPAEATGVVDRAVTRVITPGTLVDETLLDEGRPNHVAAVHVPASSGPGPGPSAAVAVVELSTGSFTLLDIPLSRLGDELARLGPSEILHDEGADAGLIEVLRAVSGCAPTPRPAWTFRQADARDCLKRHFGVATLAGFDLDDDEPAVAAAGAVLRYLQETAAPDEGEGAAGAGHAGRPARLAHLRPPRRDDHRGYVTLDAATLVNLEIERTMRRGTAEGSLLSIFGHCRTAMGKRALRRRLCFPLSDRGAIDARLDAVAALHSDREGAEILATSIARVQDVARIAGRVCLGRATPRDVVALCRSLSALPDLLSALESRSALAGLRGRLEAVAEPLGALAGAIARTCVDDPPAHLREGGLFRDGADGALDEARRLQRDATGWLAEYQRGLIARSGIGSLKVGYNKVFGYYIEVTHAHGDKIPADFSRKQTLKNAERYITAELKTFEDRVLSASSEAIDREKALFEELCGRLAARAAEQAEFADVVAELDVVTCFAEVARRNGYVRPRLVDEPVLLVRGGRHPVLDRVLGEQFVPNDCVLGRPGGAEASLALITGPNMAGKSTYIRQVALIVLLAHAGSFVPAEEAVIGLTDRIFTRIGAADELHAGRSTFMVEMTETACILHNARASSLVILDEVGRGTSTLDGLSLAWAITEALAARGCRTLFATHYHELTALADDVPAVTNLHVSVREWGDEIVFLHRILPGRTDRSYGIHVARIAGVPAATIDRAAKVLETLTVHAAHDRPGAASPGGPAQLGLFTEYLPHPVIEVLRTLNLDSLTPLQAFDTLRTLKRNSDSG